MDGDNLKAQLYQLPKEILIEHIFPEMALAYKEFPRIKAERDVYERIANAEQYNCLNSDCDVFCCIDPEDLKVYFSFQGVVVCVEDDVVCIDQVHGFSIPDFGKLCWECEKYTCPQHWQGEHVVPVEGEDRGDCTCGEQVWSK